VAVLFIRVPFDAVDVNVHPTKHQVRFHSPNRVHDAVRTAVFDTLKRSDRSVWAPKDDPTKHAVSETVRSFGRGRRDVFKSRNEESDRTGESATPSPDRDRIRQSNGGQKSKTRLQGFGDGGQIEPATPTAGKNRTRHTNGGQESKIKSPFGSNDPSGTLK
jgi:DNA mismatch repair ATPase MutL